MRDSNKDNDNKPMPICLGGIGEINYGKQYRLGNRVYDSRSVAMAHCANHVGNLGGYTYLYLVIEDGSSRKQ